MEGPGPHLLQGKRRAGVAAASLTPLVFTDTRAAIDGDVLATDASHQKRGEESAWAIASRR